MRDGVHLSADIYRPDTAGRFPGLLVVTPYNNQWEIYVSQAEHFARRGYAVALVDSRGRHDSEGEWDPYVNEPLDGYDAQQWLGQQSWCNGKIGTFGESYVPFTQIMARSLEMWPWEDLRVMSTASARIWTTWSLRRPADLKCAKDPGRVSLMQLRGAGDQGDLPLEGRLGPNPVTC